MNDTPIIINNFNRISCTRDMFEFLSTMQALLLKYNENKIGLALRIDDVPKNVTEIALAAR